MRTKSTNEKIEKTLQQYFSAKEKMNSAEYTLKQLVKPEYDRCLLVGDLKGLEELLQTIPKEFSFRQEIAQSYTELSQKIKYR